MTKSINLSYRAFIALFFIFIGVFSYNEKKVFAADIYTYQNGFEMDTSGWIDGGSYGKIERVPSGTNGIISKSGDYHALVSQNGASYASYTNFDSYSSVWPGDWKAQIDVYLDPSWDEGSGFLYTIASNNTNGTFLREYGITAGVLNDESTNNENKLIIIKDGSGAPPNDLLFQIKITPEENRVEITEAGWYTIEHYFQDVDGVLMTTISLYNSSGVKILSYTPPELGELISNTGGNRYGWFTHAVAENGIAIDNVRRFIVSTENDIDTENNPSQKNRVVGIKYGCKDEKAINYDYFSAHNQSLCQYVTSNLVNPESVSKIIFTRDLRYGMQGGDVKSLQELLVKKNIGPEARTLAEFGIDNIFGRRTQAALIEYQKAFLINSNLGVFDSITRLHLQSN